jgi:hypothetical protein
MHSDKASNLQVADAQTTDLDERATLMIINNIIETKGW